MKKLILMSAMVALCFATGFTCSKQAPVPNNPAPTEVPPPSQEQMGAPVPDQAAPPAEPPATPPPATPPATPEGH